MFVRYIYKGGEHTKAVHALCCENEPRSWNMCARGIASARRYLQPRHAVFMAVRAGRLAAVEIAVAELACSYGYGRVLVIIYSVI